MRKDVKFGLAVGAVLLAVMIAYLLVVPGETPRHGAELTLGEPTAPVIETTPETPPAPAVAEVAAPAPPALAVETAAPPAAPAPVAAANNTVDWDKLLKTGQMTPLMTQTPTSPTPAVLEVVPAAASAMSSTPAPSAAAPAVLSVAPATRPATGRTHRVQRGETFSSIAAAVYGKKSYYTKIAAANPTVAPERLREGMTIVLPAINETPAAEVHAAAPIDSARAYKVQSGDTLHRISQKLYGNSGMWEKIYAANKEAIGSDPARLKLGMVLRLPAPPTVASR